MTSFFEGCFSAVNDAIIVTLESNGEIVYSNASFKIASEFYGFSKESGKIEDILLPDSLRIFLNFSPSKPESVRIKLAGLKSDKYIDSVISILEVNSIKYRVLNLGNLKFEIQSFTKEYEENILIELFESMPLIYWVCDINSIVKQISGKGLERLQISETESIDKPIFEVFNDAPQLQRDFATCLTGKEYKTVIKSANRVFEATYQPIYDIAHNICGVFGLFIDLSAKDQSDDMLISKDVFLNTVFNSMQISLALASTEGKIQYINSTNASFSVHANMLPIHLSLGLNMLGQFSQKAQEGDRYCGIIESGLNDVINEHSAEFRYHYPGYQPTSGTLLLVFGNKLDFLRSSLSVLFVTIDKVDNISRDLRRIESNYIELLENYTNVVFSLDVDGTIVALNNSFEVFSGWKREEVIGKSFLEIIYHSDIGLGYSVFKKMVDGENHPPYELRIVTPNGGYNIAQFQTKPIFDSGKVIGVIGIAQNITDLRNTEKALKKSEWLYRSVVNSQTEMICRFNSDFKISFVNDAFCRYFGKRRDELLTTNFLTLIPEEDVDVVKERYSKLLKNPEKIVYEHRSIAADGFIRWQKWVDQPIFDSFGEISEIQSVGIDITDLKLAEEALRKSEERFRAIIENVSDIVMLYNSEGQLIYISQSVKPILGYEIEEVLEKTVQEDLIHPEDEGVLMDAFSEIIARKGEPFRFEVRFRHKSGRWLHLEGSGVNKLAVQNLKAIVVLCHDITERKDSEEIRKGLEQELTKLSLVARQTTSAVIITDTDHNINWVNEAFINLSGFSYSETESQNIDLLLAGNKTNMDSITEFRSKLDLGLNAKTRLYLYNKDKVGFWAEVFIDPMYNNDGDQIGFIRVINDISELIEQEEALLKAKDKAEEMNRIKSIFLANMSHELRTPMIGILGYAEMLSEDLEDDEMRGMAEVILGSGKRLLETLNLLLDLSKIEASKLDMNVSNFNFCKLIKDVSNTYVNEINRKGLYLKLFFKQEEVPVLLDERLARDIVSNLVNNAVKFTNSGGITIEVLEEMRGDDRWVVAKIHDTGIGIPVESREIIFEEFRQASEGLNRNFEGSGLGLTITRKYIETLHGTVFVADKKTVGSTLVIEVPAEYSSQRTRESYLHTNSTDSNSHLEPAIDPLGKIHDILLVENDPVSQKLVNVYLKKICNIDFAETGEIALTKVQQKQYKVILMDINLGSGLNGVEATQIIKSLPGYKDVAIIAITAFAMKGDKEEFLASGCVDYIAKPYDKETLSNTVKKHLLN